MGNVYAPIVVLWRRYRVLQVAELVGGSPEVFKISLSAVLGGITFKIIERFLNAKSFVDEHTALRAELRAELDKVRAEVIHLRNEVDSWRDKYYSQVEITNNLQAELTLLRVELEDYKNTHPSGEHKAL